MTECRDIEFAGLVVRALFRSPDSRLLSTLWSNCYIDLNLDLINFNGLSQIIFIFDIGVVKSKRKWEEGLWNTSLYFRFRLENKLESLIWATE